MGLALRLGLGLGLTLTLTLTLTLPNPNPNPNPNEAAVATLRAQREWTVHKVERKKREVGPPAPYNTASLQMDASRRLSLPVSVVMRHAQTLYPQAG